MAEGFPRGVRIRTPFLVYSWMLAKTLRTIAPG